MSLMTTKIRATQVVVSLMMDIFTAILVVMSLMVNLFSVILGELAQKRLREAFKERDLHKIC